MGTIQKEKTLFSSCLLNNSVKSLLFSFILIGIKGSIGDDDMVHEEDAHDFAGFLNLKGKLVVCLAGERTVARGIVTEGNDGGVVEHGFLDEQPDIHGWFRNASERDTGSRDEFEILVHHQYPRLIGIEILHLGEHIVVDGER